MTKVVPSTVVLSANTHLQVLDPVAGPVERPAGALHASDQVLVFVDDRPCYRPVDHAAPASAPAEHVTLMAGSLSPGIPRRDLVIATRQIVTIAFPVGTAPAPADELPGAVIGAAAGQWISLAVQGADAVVADGMRLNTGEFAASSAPDPVAQPPQRNSELPPLRAHAGSRELQPHSAERDGILSTWSFTIPPRTTTIRLSSASTQPDGDPRHLGVAIFRLAMDGAAIPLDSPALVRGFHRAESGEDLTWRWTDGEALLILPPRPAEQNLTVGITNWHHLLTV